MKLDDIRHGVGALWESVTDGWERLRQTAAGALTRYRPGDPADLPTRDEIDDASYMPSASWAMLGGDVFEDDKRIVVRLEAPGMNKDDFDIQVLDDALARAAVRLWQFSARRTAARAGEERQGARQLPQRRVAGGAAQANPGQAEHQGDPRELSATKPGKASLARSGSTCGAAGMKPARVAGAT
jgi:hypothetical protein